MGKGLPWFRMHVDAVDDAKLKLLAFEDRWHFVALLCLKRSGELDSPDLLDRRVAVRLGLALQEALKVRARLQEVGLIDDEWQPTGWDKRQYKSDSSAERVAEYRKRQAATAEKTDEKPDVTTEGRHSNDDVTLQGRYGNGDVTPPDTETESEREKSKTPLKPPRKRGSRLPDSFVVTDSMREWARGKGFDDAGIDAITEEFVTYWQGAGGTKLDWEKTWMNAVLKESNWRKKRGGQGTKPPSGKISSGFDKVDYGAGVDEQGGF